MRKNYNSLVIVPVFIVNLKIMSDGEHVEDLQTPDFSKTDQKHEQHVNNKMS